jgi:hypothetical protein
MDREGFYAQVAGELNDFKWLLWCRDTEGLHALVAEELNDLNDFYVVGAQKGFMRW